MKPNTKTSTSLVIPSVIQPKPRKEDIITAMVERAQIKHTAEQKKYNEQRIASLKKIEAYAEEQMKINPPKPDISSYSYSSYPRVEFRFRIETPVLKKMMAEHEKIPNLRSFDAAEVRRKIRAGMSGQSTSGVQALLTNPEAVKALDATLEAIGC